MFSDDDWVTPSEDEDPQALTIGAFARASRLSVKALRLYEQHDLLSPHHVDAGTGYRHYLPTQLEQARLIAGLREIAMPLATVAEVLQAEDQAEMDRRVAFWWAGQERSTRLRRELVQTLRASFGQGVEDRRSLTYPVAYRDTTERLVLTRHSTVSIDQLPAFIAEAIAQLGRVNEVRPGADGYFVTVIYHGRVNEDSDGPVEVCVPLAPGIAIDRDRLPPSVNLRRHLDHREAFTTLTKKDLVYPEILTAYAEIEARIRADQLVPSGPPREHYFIDIRTAQPDAPVCYAAIPIQGMQAPQIGWLADGTATEERHQTPADSTFRLG